MKKFLAALLLLNLACDEKPYIEPVNDSNKTIQETPWLFPEDKNKVIDFLRSVDKNEQKVNRIGSFGKVFFSDEKFPNLIFKESDVEQRLKGYLEAKDILKKYNLNYLKIPDMAVVNVDGKAVAVEERLKVDSKEKMDKRYEDYFAQFDTDKDLEKRFREMFNQLAIFVVAAYYNLPLLEDGSKIAIVDFDSMGKGYLNWGLFAGAKALFLGGNDDGMMGKLKRTFVYPEFFASMNNAVKTRLGIDLPWNEWGVSLSQAEDYRKQELADRKLAESRLSTVRQNVNFLNPSHLLDIKEKILQKVKQDPELGDLSPIGMFYERGDLLNFLNEAQKPSIGEPLKLKRVSFKAGITRRGQTLTLKEQIEKTDKMAKLVFEILSKENIIAGFTIDTLNNFREQNKPETGDSISDGLFFSDRIILYY
jgi:hypothetical protein